MASSHSQLALYLFGNFVLRGFLIGDILPELGLGGGEKVVISADPFLDGHAKGGKLAAVVELLHVEYRN